MTGRRRITIAASVVLLLASCENFGFGAVDGLPFAVLDDRTYDILCTVRVPGRLLGGAIPEVDLSEGLAATREIRGIKPQEAFAIRYGGTSQFECGSEDPHWLLAAVRSMTSERAAAIDAYLHTPS
jgi:hypothetical protein